MLKFESNENRKYIFLVSAIVMVISSYFTRSFINIPMAGLISPIFIIILALPSYYYFTTSQTPYKGILWLFMLGVYALFVESIGILTGLPYGEFSYNEALGFKLGVVPWPVFFAWTPLLLGSYTFTKRWFNSDKSIIMGGVILLVVSDLILDPGAVFLGFWKWDNPGVYYGVPIINFIGWIITGFGGILILHYLVFPNLPKKPEITITISFLLSITFWTSLALYNGMLLPFLIGIILFGFILFNEKRILNEST